MTSTWVQLAVGMVAVLAPLAGAVLGALLITYTPVRRPSEATDERQPRR